MVLLQQLASRWKDLRTKFGDTLLSLLSGTVGRRTTEGVWDSLALVAAQDHTLQQELESAIADDPALLTVNGVLVWFVTQGSASAPAIADAFVSYIQKKGDQQSSLVSVLASESERIGLQREELRGRLEDALRGVPAEFGDPALEALAVLFPEHSAVRDAWKELSAPIETQQDDEAHEVHAQTYFAVAYAAADSSNLLKLLERNLDRLDKIGETYFDSTLKLHVSHRLRRDSAAAGIVRNVIMNSTTPDTQAAQLVSFLADAVGIDEGLLDEVNRRIAAQKNVNLAPVVRDRAAQATLSVRTIFTRVADTTWDVGAV